MHRLKARLLGLEAKKHIVLLNEEDAADMDLKPLDRIQIHACNKRVTCIVNVTKEFIPPGEIGLFRRVQDTLKVEEGHSINVEPVEPPTSLAHIRSKLHGATLKNSHMKQIVKDVVSKKLSDIEITAFVIALENHGMSMNEAASLSKAMADSGSKIDFGRTTYDKHNIGGIPGDKTSMLLVPIVAAAGLTIPKTSSRAITSPAGTADKVECMCPVELSIKEIKAVVKRTNGCLVWGGAVDLSPADDDFIEVEYPLSIDPLLLPSVMSKKKAVGANYVVIDIPTGRGVKVKTIQDARDLGGKFIELGEKLGITVSCVSTLGDQPLGQAVGPALEAREALRIADSGRGPWDQIDKVIHMAGVLLEFAKAKEPEKRAAAILRSGRAGKKLRQIIGEQGGNPRMKAHDIPVGDCCVSIKSNQSGNVLWINNRAVIRIAREAGAPKDKGAGIMLHRKMEDRVRKGDTLFELYSEKRFKLNRALKLVNEMNLMGIGQEKDMVLAEIPEDTEEKKFFILER
jgi:AMP phosphorylase